MPSGNEMVGPGTYEVNAMNAIGAGRVDEAQVHAILALASAVSRLAAAQGNHCGRAGVTGLPASDVAKHDQPLTRPRTGAA